MTNLTNALASRIANEDEIHFVHARNRVLLAIRIVEAAERLAQFGAYGYITEVIDGRYDLRDALLAEIGRADLPSTDTLLLAREIAA